MYGQVVEIDEKVTSMMMNKGRCRVTCELNKDSFYPRETVAISSAFDNTECKKQIEKYTAVLLRRIQVFNMQADKLFFQREQILLQDVQTPGKDMKDKGIEQKQFAFDIPESIFVSEAEKQKMQYNITSDEKGVSYGLSSSVSGQLFKIQYIVQVFVKHQGIGKKIGKGNDFGSMKEVSIPIIIMTPNKNVMSSYKYKIKALPGWAPYEYKQNDFYMTPEMENQHPYSQYRKWLIGRERAYVDKMQKAQKESQSLKFDKDSKDDSSYKVKRNKGLLDDEDQSFSAKTLNKKRHTISMDAFNKKSTLASSSKAKDPFHFYSA